MSLNGPNRRSFLTALSALPGFGALLPAGFAAAPRESQPRDVAAELGVRTIINAAGTYTTLTASLMPSEVFDAMQVASRKFVPLNELHDAIGARIAELLHCEAAMVSAGCASALSVATAACVAGADRDKIRQIPDTHNLKNEVIVQKAHRNGYDHAIRNAGVEIIEVETAQELERAVNHRTAMMAFFNFATPNGKIAHEEFVALAKKHGIPTLIDAAADVPPVDNLYRFTKLGFDLVAFSGGKGMCGPQSAGLLLGRKDLIEAARMNDSPNSDSLCRTNKVNKEEMIGMLVALELFLHRDHEAVWKDWEARCNRIAEAVAGIKTVKTETFVPEIANAVPHLRIVWDEKALGMSPRDVAQKMRQGEPSIEVRPGARDVLEIGVWMLQPGEDAIVARRLHEVLQSA
jgi:L-seryl-tRNA(Ser) seleniumtransferase